MSVENDGDRVTIVCDECGDEGPSGPRDEFFLVVQAAKLKGWKIENRRGAYFHTCASCCDELAAFGIVDVE